MTNQRYSENAREADTGASKIGVEQKRDLIDLIDDDGNERGDKQTLGSGQYRVRTSSRILNSFFCMPFREGTVLCRTVAMYKH